jgi:ribose 5-phosphate isomerase A
VRPGSNQVLPQREALKRDAGVSAAKHVHDGMVVGLGTGSTVKYVLEHLGRERQLGLHIEAVPTSEATRELMRRYDIKETTLERHPTLDLVIDGADEIDGRLRLIKGGGGALTREKVVARAGKRFLVVADSAKVVKHLGSTFALPVEVVEFARVPLQRHLEHLGASTVTTRATVDGGRYLTDNGNPILDAKWPAIRDPEGLERELEMFPGVVCTGLFLGMADEAHVAFGDGVRILKPQVLP